MRFCSSWRFASFSSIAFNGESGLVHLRVRFLHHSLLSLFTQILSTGCLAPAPAAGSATAVGRAFGASLGHCRRYDEQSDH